MPKPKSQKTPEERAEAKERIAKAKEQGKAYGQRQRAKKEKAKKAAEAKAKKAAEAKAKKAQPKRTTARAKTRTTTPKTSRATIIPESPEAPKPKTNTASANVSAAQIEKAIARGNENQKKLKVVEGNLKTLNDKVNDTSEQIATTKEEVKHLKDLILETSHSLKKQGLAIIQQAKELAVNRLFFVIIAIALAYIFKRL